MCPPQLMPSSPPHAPSCSLLANHHRHTQLNLRLPSGLLSDSVTFTANTVAYYCSFHITVKFSAYTAPKGTSDIVILIDRSLAGEETRTGVIISRNFPLNISDSFVSVEFQNVQHLTLSIKVSIYKL